VERLMDPVTVVEGPVSVLDRADVDTDQIIPKQFLKRVERTGFGQFLFYDWVRSGEISLEPNPILVAGRNFGCGSSREHAPWALQDFGFRAIVAPSFADIFFTNCTKIGLLPVALPEPDCRGLADAGAGRIDLAAGTVSFAGRDVTFEIDGEVRQRLLNGLDDIGMTLEREDAIVAFEATEAASRAPATTALEARI
jgi:3-isopropylmalate/(R)-2-methylmalate dehydratase small subunit